jgi:alpha-amylase
MFADLDYSHPKVEKDVVAWGRWLGKMLPLKGIRFDAVKHFGEDFLREFITEMDTMYGQRWFFVGEFWKDKDSLDGTMRYLDRMGNTFSLFDAPQLQSNQHDRERGFDQGV